MGVRLFKILAGGTYHGREPSGLLLSGMRPIDQVRYCTLVTTLHFDADALESFVYIPLRSSHVLGAEYHHNRLRANTSVMFLMFILEHTAGPNTSSDASGPASKSRPGHSAVFP